MVHGEGEVLGFFDPPFLHPRCCMLQQGLLPGALNGRACGLARGRGGLLAHWLDRATLLGPEAQQHRPVATHGRGHTCLGFPVRCVHKKSLFSPC